MTVLSIPNRAVAPVTSHPRTVVRPATELTQMTRYRGGTYSQRVLTGVALEQASHRLTPVALAIATEMAIEFDISWEAHEPWSDIVGDGCK
jgi:hypothetical protein